MMRSLTTADEPFLWEMLYQALHIPPGKTAPPRNMIRLLELARYLQDWEREGDYGFLASDQGRSSIHWCDLVAFDDG